MLIFNEIHKVQQMKQNVSATTKGVEVVKNEDGQMISQNIALMANNKELRNLNLELSRELARYKGKVSNLTKIITHFQADTVMEAITDTIFIVQKMDSTFEYDINWRVYDGSHSSDIVVNGNSVFKTKADSVFDFKTYLKETQFNFKLYSGVYKDTKDGLWKTFVRSPDNRLCFDLESTIDPSIYSEKKTKWSIGIYGGGGINLNLLGIPTVGLGLSVGVGIMYDVFSW